MLVGCLAIAGAGLPFGVGPYHFGFSGYYSKDAIVSQALLFAKLNPLHNVLFYAVIIGAAITAFYMFRLWYLTFAGEPRDHHVYDHAHESPRPMTFPLVVLAVFAMAVAWRIPGTRWELINLLEQARPAGGPGPARLVSALGIPYEPDLHLAENASIHSTATFIAAAMALLGFVLATVFYAWRKADPGDVRRQFNPLYGFLVHKWYFDELYRTIFVRPLLFVSQRVSNFDTGIIDRSINALAGGVRWIARIDDLIDRSLIDGLVNLTARRTYAVGSSLRSVQTGRLRQYVMFIIVGFVAIFVLASFFWSYTLAGT